MLYLMNSLQIQAADSSTMEPKPDTVFSTDNPDVDNARDTTMKLSIDDSTTTQVNTDGTTTRKSDGTTIMISRQTSILQWLLAFTMTLYLFM